MPLCPYALMPLFIRTLSELAATIEAYWCLCRNFIMQRKKERQMTKGRLFFLTALAGCTLLGSLAGSAPAQAQDGPPQIRGRMIIRGPDGERVIDIDPSQLNLGDGQNVFIMRAGPDGQIMTFGGSPDMMGFINGPDGMRFLGPNGMPMMG